MNMGDPILNIFFADGRKAQFAIKTFQVCLGSNLDITAWPLFHIELYSPVHKLLA